MSRFRFELEGFLSADECKNLIERSENIGFQESLIQVRGVGQVVNKDVRDNERAFFDDKELASSLFERVLQYLPQEVESNDFNWEPLELNERFRFYKYQDGQQFKQHLDGSFVRNENEISKVTMLLYLNEDFEGGATRFVLENEAVSPKTGKLLLFRHNILHSGMPCSNGIKYVLRTDVIYKKKNQ